MPVSERLRSEIERWKQGRYEDDEDFERRLHDGAKAAAVQLLFVAGYLGWGSGEAFLDACSWLEEAAEQDAEYFRYKQPAPRVRVPRKRIPQNVVRTVWDRDGWECRECGTHCDLTVDHVNPVVLGGTDEMDNLQTLCRSCNSRKGARV